MIKQLNIQEKGISKKRLFELMASILLLLIACGLLLSGLVINPFRVANITKENRIETTYNKGIRYVRFQNQTLDFTGYYKMDKNNEIVYNCYVTRDYKKQYFVFVPVKRSEDEKGVALKTLNNYSFEARIQKDEEILKMVSSDYEMSSNQFMKKYKVSELILDEAGARRTEVLGIWIALFIILLSYCGYSILPFCWKRDIGGKQNG